MFWKDSQSGLCRTVLLSFMFLSVWDFCFLCVFWRLLSYLSAMNNPCHSNTRKLWSFLGGRIRESVRVHWEKLEFSSVIRVVCSCSSVCIKVWLEDCLCHTHLWSLLKTGSYVSAPICSYQDLWGWILGICLFNKLCKIFLMQSRVWDSEMEHWAFED